MSDNKQIGNIGESVASKYIINNGYNILEKNFRTKLGEIDLIARDGNYLVFIEVKARRVIKFGYPREAVDKFKQSRIKNIASLYLSRERLWDNMIRFDVVEVILDETNNVKLVSVIKNAFY